MILIDLHKTQRSHIKFTYYFITALEVYDDACVEIIWFRLILFISSAFSLAWSANFSLLNALSEIPWILARILTYIFIMCEKLRLSFLILKVGQNLPDWHGLWQIAEVFCNSSRQWIKQRWSTNIQD